MPSHKGPSRYHLMFLRLAEDFVTGQCQESIKAVGTSKKLLRNSGLDIVQVQYKEFLAYSISFNDGSKSQWLQEKRLTLCPQSYNHHIIPIVI